MRKEFKQFVEKVTGLRNSQFRLTRLRLTVIYAVLLLIILTLSSLTTQSLFSGRLEHRFQDRLLPPPPTQVSKETRQQIREELIKSLWLVNGTLYIGAVGLSYLLAGLTLKPIQDMYNKQKQFLGDASHELRTPLAILQTDLENELSSPKIKKEDAEQIQSHLEEVKRMSNLVRDLLLVSRLDNHEDNPVNKEPVDLKELTTEVTRRLKGYADARKTKLIILPIDDQEKIVAAANKDHLFQALSNVVKNAIDYNQPGGKVTINFERIKEQVVINVADTGVGITANEIPKLFDRFYRVDKSRAREAGGSGLGLSIVQSIINTYEGTISVRSKPEKGTTIKITLPAANGGRS